MVCCAEVRFELHNTDEIRVHLIYKNKTSIDLEKDDKHINIGGSADSSGSGVDERGKQELC